MTKDEEIQMSKPGEVVVGWLCSQYNTPGGMFPEGVNPKGGGGAGSPGYDAWCRARVEDALSDYKGAYDKIKAGDGITMEKLMREWLYDQFWNSLGYGHYGSMRVLVRSEVRRFLKMVKQEVDDFPLRMLKQISHSDETFALLTTSE